LQVPLRGTCWTPANDAIGLPTRRADRPMKVKVTALGGARRSLGRAVGDIVRYLVPAQGTPAPAAGVERATERIAGPAGYYSDRGEEPGRWYGRGAARLGLAGEVDAGDFETVLSGRDPTTGARLISARGSAGRRPHLGVGTETQWGTDGEPLYDISDAAAALDVPVEEATAMVEAGMKLAVARLFRWLAGDLAGGVPGHVPDPLPGSFLVPILDGDGRGWIAETELTRAETVRGDFDLPPAAIDGEPEEQLPIAAAAAIAGVTPRYFRVLAGRYVENRAMIDALLAAGSRPRQAHLIASQDGRGRWFVKRRDLQSYLMRRRQPPVRVAFDVTLTTEKSFSVAALLADPRKGSEVLAAIQGANETALGWLEEHAAVARVVQEVVDAEGLTIASFRHLTSRALDPFVHHHNVVANSVEVAGVGHRALDGRELFNNAKAAGALATVEARWRMTTSLGVRWRRGQSGAWEVAGIPDEVLREFSQRRNEVDEAIKELEEEIGRGATPDDIDQIARATRPDKEYVDVQRIRDEWWQRARSLGFAEADLGRCFDQPAPHPPPPRGWLFAQLAAPGTGVCRDRSICDTGDVLATLAELTVPQPGAAEPQPLIVSAEELTAIAHAFLRSDDVVQLRGGRHGLFTTREILAVQERIVARFEQGLDVRTSGIVPASVLRRTLDAHPILNAEQRQLVGCR
jgi:conjugative relaxase-like TrwC/TraI family protein